MVGLNSDALEVKQLLMNIVIFILIVLIVAFSSIYIVIGVVERKRAKQQSEISKLKVQQETSEKILHEQRRLNAAIMAAGFGVLDWQLDSQNIELNDRWLEFMDISRKDFNKNGMGEVLRKINNPRMKSIPEMLELLKYSDKIEFRNELEIERKDGRKLWIESIDYIIDRDLTRKPVHIIGFVHDITSRKQSEYKLRESFNIVKLSGSHGKIGYWEFDISKSKPEVSDEWLELFNISREEFNAAEYNDWIKNIREDYREQAKRNHNEISKGAITKFQTEYNIYHPTRGEIWIEGMGQVSQYNSIGRIIKYIGYHQDITSRKQSEIKALKDASELKSWYNNMNMAFCVCSIVNNSKARAIDLKFVFVNNEFCNLLNLSDEKLIGQSTASLLFNDFNRSILSKIESLQSVGTIKFEIYEGFLNKHMEVSAFVIGDNKFAMLFYDITDRYKLEQKLLAEQTYYRSLFEMSRDAIFLINTNDLSFIDANEASLELFGAQRKQDLMMINYLLLHPATQKNGQLTKTVIRYALKNSQTISGENYEMIFRKITGQEFIGQIKFSLVDYNNTSAVLGIVRDVTNMHNAMENLERTQSWLQTIIDSVNSVIVVKDNYGKIMACNQMYNKTLDLQQVLQRGCILMTFIILTSQKQLKLLMKKLLCSAWLEHTNRS
jgi:PAS domain S-box-containing protein